MKADALSPAARTRPAGAAWRRRRRALVGSLPGVGPGAARRSGPGLRSSGGSPVVESLKAIGGGGGGTERGGSPSAAARSIGAVAGGPTGAVRAGRPLEAARRSWSRRSRSARSSSALMSVVAVPHAVVLQLGVAAAGGHRRDRLVGRPVLGHAGRTGGGRGRAGPSWSATGTAAPRWWSSATPTRSSDAVVVVLEPGGVAPVVGSGAASPWASAAAPARTAGGDDHRVVDVPRLGDDERDRPGPSRASVPSAAAGRRPRARSAGPRNRRRRGPARRTRPPSMRRPAARPWWRARVPGVVPCCLPDDRAHADRPTRRSSDRVWA